MYCEPVAIENRSGIKWASVLDVTIPAYDDCGLPHANIITSATTMEPVLEQHNNNFFFLQPFFLVLSCCTVACQLNVVLRYPAEFPKLNPAVVTGLAIHLCGIAFSAWALLFADSSDFWLKHFTELYMPMPLLWRSSVVLYTLTTVLSIVIGLELARFCAASLSLSTPQANYDIFCAETIPCIAFFLLPLLAHTWKMAESIQNYGYARFFPSAEGLIAIAEVAVAVPNNVMPAPRSEESISAQEIRVYSRL